MAAASVSLTSDATTVKEGWLQKRGKRLKNWSTRWFVLKSDGQFIGYHRKPTPGRPVDPSNSFRVDRIHLAKKDKIKKNAFVLRCLQTTVVERTFCVDTESECKEWMEAIQSVADKLIQQDYKASSDPNAIKKFEDYEPLKVIGKGTFAKGAMTSSTLGHLLEWSFTSLGTKFGGVTINRDRMVMMCRDKATKEIFAMKILKKNIIAKDEIPYILAQNRVLQSTNHPFLVSLQYAFQNDTRIFFIMEYVNGGDLLFHLSHERIFLKDEVHLYGAEITLAIGYLHQRRIVHRNLKLETVMLDSEGHVKLIGFGSCKEKIAFGATARTFCGTPDYLAPEILQGNEYGEAVDWWAVGVILYAMMCGQMPFHSSNNEEVLELILREEVKFPSSISEAAKSLLTGLLTKNPDKRLGGGREDAEEVKRHPFYASMNWQDLFNKKITPPFMPYIHSKTDVSYFDTEFTMEAPQLTPPKISMRNQEIEQTMLKARDAKCSVPLRYGKVLFCGATAAGKSNFLNLLMEEDFQPLHISTGVIKSHQISIAIKAIVSSDDDDETEFRRMDIDNEILQLESYIPEKHTASASNVFTFDLEVPTKDFETESYSETKSYSKTESLKHVESKTKVESEFKSKPDHKNVDDTTVSDKLALANVNTEAKKLNKKPHGKTWDILTFMDTGGQPQFISMLPAVNSFAMITFIIHKMEPGGKKSLDKMVKVQYGNDKGEISFKIHPHKYTYHQLIETLISYSSNILLPDTEFLDKLKVENIKTEASKSISLVGTHSGNEQLLEEDINEIDKELTKVVKQSGVNHIKPSLNKNYQSLVPVDNKVQGENLQTPSVMEDTKRYTKPSKIRHYIQKFLNNQDVIHVPIKWLLLELEIRKMCQEKHSNLIAYSKVKELAKRKKLDYNGEFGDDITIAGDQFIKQGLRFHHSFGVLLYFEEVEGMQELVITNHQWLFDKLSRIVEYSFSCDTQEETKDLHNGIFKRALFGKDCLDISKDFEDSQIDTKIIDPINAFLKLLEHLRIAAPLNETTDKYFMPCLLQSCDLNDIREKIPEYKGKNIEPLLIQFKSIDNKTYALPRGIFCFLVVELMVSMKWELYGQAYVNLLTLFKKDTAHYITLVDRIFCLEVHVTYKENGNIHSEVLTAVKNSLQLISKKLKIPDNLCYGFMCLCQLNEEMHVSYLREENDKYCWCAENSSTELTDVHTIWLKEYKVTFSRSKSLQRASIAHGSPLSKSMEMKASVEPSYQNLLPYIEHVDDWRSLGTYLLPDEYTPRLLNDIERTYNSRVHECRVALVNEYFKVGEVSWDKVIYSLEKSHFSNVAKIIKRDIFRCDT